METLWWRKRRKRSSAGPLLFFIPTMPFTAFPAHSTRAPHEFIWTESSSFPNCHTTALVSRLNRLLLPHGACCQFLHPRSNPAMARGHETYWGGLGGPHIFSGPREDLRREDPKTAAHKWYLDPMVTVNGFSLFLSWANNSPSGALALCIQLHVPLHATMRKMPRIYPGYG